MLSFGCVFSKIISWFLAEVFYKHSAYDYFQVLGKANWLQCSQKGISMYSAFKYLLKKNPREVLSGLCLFCSSIIQGQENIRQPLIHAGQIAAPKAQITPNYRV